MRKTQTLFMLFFLLLLLVGCAQMPSRKNQVSSEIEAAVTEAFVQQSLENADEEIVFLFFDTQIDYIEFNQDQTQALVWFALLDSETGAVNGTEPGLVLAELTNENPKDPASWTMTFQHQPEWTTAVWQTDIGLLNTEEKQTFSGKAQVVPHAGKIYTGYKLPWEQGQRAKLSGSIAHVLIYKTCPTTCLYAFDFWTGDMFPVHAAKGGVVKIAKWDVENGDTSATNYLLVEDTSTDPTTFAIYYHLANESIPEALRTPGAQVYQGQFIGNADDTGASTAHHLHFMVHTNPVSYWGSSVDIVFDEVDINGGRPRTCNEVELFSEYGTECHEGGDWFYSDNEDNRPPTAWISSPEENTIITTQSFTATAEASDDISIKTISMFIRQGNEGWQEVGESQNQNTLTAEIDMCALGLQDGDFLLALEVIDSSGKITHTYDTPMTLTKAFDCQSAPPACLPEPNQIALYTEVNYRGRCSLVNIGQYFGMIYVSGIENDEVSSIMTGGHAYTILYTDNNLKGNYEVFTSNDPNLSDNTIGENTVSSLSVILPPDRVHAPILPDSFSVQENEFVEVSWDGDAEEYYAELQQGTESIMTQDWSPETSLVIGYLAPGEYSLTVVARNITGVAQSSMTFTVNESSNTRPETELSTLPITSKNSIVELKWDVTEGRENIDHFEIQYRISDGVWDFLHDDLGADQSSALAILQAGNSYEFRMRAVAIEGPSEDFPVIAETSIEIISHCGLELYTLNDTMENATPLETRETQIHSFCPANDVDWLKVEVDSTDKITIAVDPLENQLPIKAEVYTPQKELSQTIYISEGKAKIRITPQSQQTGSWYIRFQPYDPLIFGDDTAYQVEIHQTLFMRNFSATTMLAIGIIILALFLGVFYSKKAR